ncbi:MAG: carbohydrate-binding family 9-like protein [Bryobacterales bacterium]|nr:carbohydrate-binding family 9-like protein [Bryobacterales bacterium]
MRLSIFFLTVCGLFADGPGRLESKYTASDFDLTANPNAVQWKSVKPVYAYNDRYGKPVPGHRTELRSRWTKDFLYILYVCPYEKLYMKPDPTAAEETNKLWDWDVAEAFIGSDFQNINRYKEFQVSPQGEWVDLDIDRVTPISQAWKWNSGFQVKARIDAKKKIWYGEMKIPMKAIDTREAVAGNEFRCNLYRIQGPFEPQRKHIAWNAVNAESYHTPEAFGRLVLVR